jgi:hypothetical protein
MENVKESCPYCGEEVNFSIRKNSELLDVYQNKDIGLESIKDGRKMIRCTECEENFVAIFSI